jgi:sarcosine oxidase subunit beta
MNCCPALEDAQIVRSWAGCLDLCQDGVPVLGFVDEVPGLVVACAFSGHGFGIGPAVGEQMAMLICEGKTSVDISGLQYGRFKAKI